MRRRYGRSKHRFIHSVVCWVFCLNVTIPASLTQLSLRSLRVGPPKCNTFDHAM